MGILIIIVLVSFSGTSCGIQHTQIINDITLYEQSFDPEFCEMVIDKIDLFNDTCEPQIEILDCG